VGKIHGKIPRNVAQTGYYLLMPQNGVHADRDAVRQRREARLLTQDELARLADIHPNTLARIEADATYRTGFKTLRKIANKLGCEPTDLVRLVEEEGAA
jgi:transcriptional regulator with XRE-family HTH domain